MWIWANVEPERLPSDLAQVIERAGTPLAISLISIWEALVAMERGRIQVASTPEGTVRMWLSSSPIQVIPIEPEVAILSRTLTFEHDDPADRFIAATAHWLGCPLATLDAKLRRLAWLKLHA
ncbi:MAG: type II toxin-antitoxin system VapC family toxin [Nitrospirae bacterium]|nr:type II toxin-antitoxin system VapC family toxin [Fimbriimonadaceae bacterium]